MDALTPIHRLHQHRAWANRRVRDAARALTPTQLNQRFEIGAGSVMATLTHLHAAELVWLAALRGQAKTRSPFDFHYDSFAQLEAAWDESERGWSGLLASLTVDDLTRPITKTASLSGATFTTPMLDILLHVCTHAQYTTAQAVNMLRRLGVPGKALPDVMVISLSRAEQAGRSASV